MSEGTEDKKEGEGIVLLEHIREISQDLLTNMKDIDHRLAMLAEQIKQREEYNKQELLSTISSIRFRIGALEKEDMEEMKDEEILENMMKKLDTLIQLTIGEKS